MTEKIIHDSEALDAVCTARGDFIVPRTTADLEAVLSNARDNHKAAYEALQSGERFRGPLTSIEGQLKNLSDDPTAIIDGNTRYQATLFIDQILWHEYREKQDTAALEGTHKRNGVFRMIGAVWQRAAALLA